MTEFESRKIADLYSQNGAESLEVLEYKSATDAPTLGLISGVHGDETGPNQVLEGIKQMLEESEIELNISLISEAKILAADSENPTRKTPPELQPNRADETDLNRVFGTAEDNSHEKLSITGELGKNILEYIEENVDFIVDNHTGTYPTKKIPQVRYKYRESFPIEEREMRVVAENSGTDYMLVTQPVADAEMLSAVAPSIGIPALTVEAGGATRPEDRSAFGDTEYESYIQILENILYYLDQGRETENIPEKLGAGRKYFAAVNFDVVKIEEAGEIEYFAELGDKVDEGDKIAEIEWQMENGDARFSTHRAKEHGILETVRNPNNRDNLYQNDRIFNIAAEK